MRCISFFKETLIKSLPDFILGFLYRARNHLTRIASYLRKMMTKPCIKIHVKSDSAIESAFPYILSYLAFTVVNRMPRGLQCGMKMTVFSHRTTSVEAAQTVELRELVKSSPRLNKIPISIFPITLGLC